MFINVQHASSLQSDINVSFKYNGQDDVKSNDWPRSWRKITNSLRGTQKQSKHVWALYDQNFNELSLTVKLNTYFFCCDICRATVNLQSSPTDNPWRQFLKENIGKIFFKN